VIPITANRVYFDEWTRIASEQSATYAVCRLEHESEAKSIFPISVDSTQSSFCGRRKILSQLGLGFFLPPVVRMTTLYTNAKSALKEAAEESRMSKISLLSG
jgi:hypothetical protein